MDVVDCCLQWERLRFRPMLCLESPGHAHHHMAAAKHQALIDTVARVQARRHCVAIALEMLLVEISVGRVRKFQRSRGGVQRIRELLRRIRLTWRATQRLQRKSARAVKRVSQATQHEPCKNCGMLRVLCGRVWQDSMNSDFPWRLRPGHLTEDSLVTGFIPISRCPAVGS